MIVIFVQHVSSDRVQPLRVHKNCRRHDLALSDCARMPAFLFLNLLPAQTSFTRFPCRPSTTRICYIFAQIHPRAHFAIPDFISFGVPRQLHQNSKLSTGFS